MQIARCVAQWAIWHFCPHAAEFVINYLLCREYCKLWYGKQISKYLSRWAFSFSYFFSMSYFFLFLFVLDTFAANQLSDIPFEARQAASVSEMLRLISCHKPNDKTYFSDLLPLSTKFLVVVVFVAPNVIIVIMFIYGMAREKKINFKFDYNKNKATHAHTTLKSSHL